MAAATSRSGQGGSGGGGGGGSGKKGSPCTSVATSESTPLVADSIDSWGLHGRYEMPSKPDAGW
jgi:hypothetical protein